MNKFYIVCINWDKAKQEKPHTMERLKYVKLNAFNEGSDISNYIQYYDKYNEGWRVYLFKTRKKAEQIFNITMNK